MNNETHQMFRHLQKVFGIWAGIELAVFILIFFLHRAGMTPQPASPPLWISGIVLLVLTAGLSVAAPIMIRSLYVSRTLKTRRFHTGEYRSLQARLIAVTMAGMLCAAGSYFLRVPKLHLYGAMIAGLYGVYSTIPSKKKIQGELNYFEARCR